MSNHNLCFEQKYEKYQNFLSKNFAFLVVKFSIYLNRHVFVMLWLVNDHPAKIDPTVDMQADLSLPGVYMSKGTFFFHMCRPKSACASLQTDKSQHTWYTWQTKSCPFWVQWWYFLNFFVCLKDRIKFDKRHCIIEKGLKLFCKWSGCCYVNAFGWLRRRWWGVGFIEN